MFLKKEMLVGCSKCIIDNVIIDLQKIHGKKYDYSKIKLKYKSFPMIIICPDHGVFYQQPRLHLRGSNGCNVFINKKLKL